VAGSGSSLPAPGFVASDILAPLIRANTAQYPGKLTVPLRPRAGQRALAQLGDCMGLLLQAVRAHHLRLGWCDVPQVTAVPLGLGGEAAMIESIGVCGTPPGDSELSDCEVAVAGEVVEGCLVGPGGVA
jgi:hypothetical protein